jgi:hypothetical protein
MTHLSPCIILHPYCWTPILNQAWFSSVDLRLALLALIQVHGLTSRPELNGKTGQIVTR